MKYALAIAALLACAPAWAQLQPRTQHQKLDLILEELAAIKAQLGVKPPVAVVVPVVPPGAATPVPVPPPAPTPPPVSGIDYRPFSDMTPQEIQGAFGPFRGQGLPAGWDWAAAFAAGVINPDAAPRPPQPPGPPPVSGLPFDQPAFDWTHPGSWRRFIGPSATKVLAVPTGFDGLVGLFVSAVTENRVSHVRIVVRDGAAIVAENPNANTTGDWLKFQARGGTTYTVTVEGDGAVVSINLVPGG